MPTRRRSNQPAQSIAPLLVVAAIGLAAVSSWFGLPAIAVLWVCMLVVAWLEPPAVLTGKKDDWGYSTPANSTEEAHFRRFRQWRQLRFALVPLPGLAIGLLPGWPPLASWCAGVWAAGLAWFVPVVGNRYLHAPAGHALDAAAAFVLVVEIVAARRAVVSADHPGTRLDAFGHLLRTSPAATLLRMAAGIAVGFVLGVVLVTVAHDYSSGFGWGGLVAQLHLGHGLAHPGFTLSSPAELYGLLMCGGAFLAVAGPWQKTALEGWSELKSIRQTWDARWAGLKLDLPTLVGHETVGTATVATFEAPPHLGAGAFLHLGPKLVPALGTAVAVLECPQTSAGIPVPGTVHPRRFAIVSWPSGSLPDPTTEGDPRVVELFAHAAMVWTLEPLGYGRPVPIRLDLLTAPESSPRIWSSAWAWPGGPDLKTVREASAPGGGPLVAQFPAAFSCPVLMDHHAGDGGLVYFGAIGDEEAVLAEDNQDLVARFEELATEDHWMLVWESVLKRGAVRPSIYHKMTATHTLTDGVSVKRMAFLTPWGVDPADFFGLEPKLATALGAAPFVSVTGWTQKGSGERHPQAFAVYWSDIAVPGSPDLVPPSEAAPWVLAGHLNAAFDDVKFARPEVADAVVLSTQSSRAHLWKIVLRLYGGVTAADVRARSERIRRAMHVPWLRIEDDPTGVVFYAGAEPASVELAHQKDALHLAALDWDQTFADVNIVGSDGDVPHLTALGRLPHNPAVEVRDFILPPGVDRARVRAATGKLRAATGNAFVDVRESPRGASSIRLLVSRESPLPQTVPFDFDAADQLGGFVFATGVEGEPVVFDPAESPHILLAGVTGAGKTALASALLYDAASKGVEIFVIDPVKAGADYAFLRAYARSFATTPIEAAAVMRAVSAEVARRKQLNADHGVGSYFELPDDVRPKPIFLMIDEFTSLIGQDPVPKQPFDDPEEEAERQLLLQINQAKLQVGVYAGRLAREARSSGVTLLLGTQRLSARVLEAVPSSSDLRTNLARVLLGKASWGDRAAALRSPDDAPVLDEDIPKGRGLWEPLTSAAVVVQCWWATQDQFRFELERRVEPLSPTDRLDLSPWMPKDVADGLPSTSSAADDAVVDLGELELSLDDLEPEPVTDAAAELVSEPIADDTDPQDDSRWAIDWGEGAGEDNRAGPAEPALDDRAGAAEPVTIAVDSEDEWGVVPEIPRRQDTTPAQAGDGVADEEWF